MDVHGAVQNSYFDIEHLCNEAVTRNFRGDPNAVPSIISQATYEHVWNTFVQWCQSEVDQGRAVHVGQFGHIGYQQVRDNMRILYVKLSDHFLQTHKLVYKPEMANFGDVVLQPVTRPNFTTMAKNIQVDKGTFQTVLLNIFQVIGELLNESQMVDIDLGEMGKFCGNNRQVLYDPLNKMKPQAPQGKQTVKALMDFGVNQNAQYYYSQNAAYQDQMDQMYASHSSKNKSLRGVMGGITGESPSRRYKKPYGDGKITKDLLGAGDDPLAKNQEYSLLASNAQVLMKQTFKKPGKATSRYPPVIDAFSRTLAAPISSERHYFSVCHKVGTNFTPTAKGFYIDVDARVIKYKRMDQGNTKLDIVGQGADNIFSMVEPASEQEEYEALIYPQNADKKRIQARKVSYARYRQYVENEISVDVIAPIRQYWLTHIIELIPGDLHAVEKERIEYLIDTMLNEINKDYFDSVRKSILDYILKNEAEMKRLGIQQVLNQPIDWGDDFYKGIEPNEEWKHNVMMARMLMSENLCICSQATLELMKLWRDYKGYLFVNLPAPRDEPQDLYEFMNHQEVQMQKVKGLLSTDWNKSAVDILREELENLDKDQTKTFFESTATLMANQVRELIEQSINKYVDFIQRFKFDEYPTPEEIIQREYDADSPYEDNFIAIKLDIDTNNNQIKFQVALTDVQHELEVIVDQIVAQSKNLPRPENTIQRSDKQHLWDVPANDEIVEKAKATISETIEENLAIVKKALEIYKPFVFILNEKERIEEFLKKEPFDRDEFQAEIDKYHDTIREIREKMPFEIRMNMFLIQCHDINNQLCEKCEELISEILQTVSTHVFAKLANSLTNEVKQIKDETSTKADNSNMLVDFEQKLERIKLKDRHRLKADYTDMIEWLTMLFQNRSYRPQDDNIKPIITAYDSINQIEDIIDTKEGQLKSDRDEIEKKLMEQKRSFAKDLERVHSDVNQFATAEAARRAQEFKNTIAEIQERIKSMTQELTHIHQQETDLEMMPGEYPILDQVKVDIIPHKELWDLQVDFQARWKEWNSGSLKGLNPEEVEAQHGKMRTQAMKLANIFDQKRNPPMPKPKAVANRMYRDLMDFKEYVPIIRSLCNEGLQDRHIKVIFMEMKINQNHYKKLEDMSIADLKGFQVADYKDKLDEISDQASKEFANKNTMNNMKKEWEALSFDCKMLPGKESYILNGEAVELIQTALDDHIIKTQTMKGSPFAKFMIDEVHEWEKTLMETTENLEMWLKVQQVWMYLEPVFSSDDIMNQMPVEGRNFKEVNVAWHDLMNRINGNPAAMDVIKIQTLGETLKIANTKLEKVQKGLNEYLESKRGLFPRFYFLSNDELLEILSETKEPLRVQPHLKKCFEGIDKLRFDEEKKIHGMFSVEGEEVAYTRIIDTAASKGAVEDWLVQVEEVMLKSVKNVIEQSYQDYLKRSRDKWVISWAGQAVLAISMMFWTMQAEEAMKKSGLPGLQQFWDRLNNQLQDTVGVVRTNISKLQRATLEALIVLDVHAKDVIQENLIDQQISDPSDFEWLSQLRYYWEDNNVWAKIINSVLEYNYEYLGNSARLVITPLTDRCYRTLCGAIYLHYGGAPEGPAGTGKTETVKDLSKALARQCIVFNCSDGLDYKTMGKFFKGLACCGAWSCFDEFNRIELEVLSVIAQQVQTIQHGIDKGLDRFFFEDAEIPLKHTCNCFITMNPGYAGRSELPDNLKALFRSVAMMVPDYTMIARISLYSFGFADAPALAKKITTTYKLCSEQLSSQKHYDYGMRAVKSVLTAAGNLKRKLMDENESILMLRAINDVNLAKFLAHDLPLFRNITSDLFPGVVLPEPDYNDLMRCMKENMTKMNLQHHPYFIMKIIQLYEMIVVRHGLMIVGLPFSGKTMCLKVLQAALTQLNAEGKMEEMKTHIITINPKSITMNQLYGCFDEVSHDWSDGVLAVEYRKMAQCPQGEGGFKMKLEDRRWLIFDGPVDAVWIENMNTVLDDNKKLCLMSSEVIAMTPGMSMIFEPMDLQEASPATVSRCGMVYLQPHEMGWHHLYMSWKTNLPTTFGADQTKVLDNLVEVVVQPTIDHLRKEQKEEAPTEDQNLVVSMLRILRALLNVFDDEGHFNQLDKKQVAEVIESSFIMSCIWSLCMTVRTESRKPLDMYFKKVVNGEIEGLQKLKNKIKAPFFDRGTIYDYCYLPEQNKWQNWMDFTNKDDIDKFPKGSVVQELIVTTPETIKYGYMQEFFIMNDIRSLFVGPTGTGKTKYIQNVLNQKLEAAKWLIIEVGFSAQTHCNMVQDIVDMKLEKRRRDTFGPRFGQRCIVYVDDLNMPKLEKYGAQPPIEILRQLVDGDGWYDRKDNKHPFRTIVDTMVIASMGTPGGGKSFITPRFQRHFNIVAFANFDESSLNTIFRSILKWHFREGGFSPDVAGLEQKVVMATFKIYEKIQSDLRPTPAKTHYTFNLRDFSKIICGFCNCKKAQLEQSDTAIRLWAHETVRILGDRLINDEDRMWMLEAVKECVRAPFSGNFDSVFGHLDNDGDNKVTTLNEFRGLLFGDIFTSFGMPDRIYEEIKDKHKLQKAADEALVQYNSLSDKPMNLVLFNYATEHLLRVRRIISQSGGHGLLVGVGGSGRQSMTRLASLMGDFDVFSIEIKKNYRTQEWREDMKALMRQAGTKGRQTTFLFTDTQIKQESFLEDVNNILNTGEIPNIFAADEKADICENVRGPAKEEGRCEDGTPAQLFAFFQERCKNCLHVVLAFSPIGASLRNRIRDFPSVVNCTTIDWFSAWPPDALEAVAQKFLSEIDMEKAVRQSCVQMVQEFHTTTQAAATRFEQQLGRVYYVTPTSYLELINTFKSLLGEKRTEIKNLKDRYGNGYDCLIQTESSVNVMEKELVDLQPILIQKGKETEEKLVIVTKETEAADLIKQNVSKEEAEAQKIADEANEIKTDCEQQLAEAIPALKAAEDAVNCITKGDIAQLKGYSKPPAPVALVTQVVCMFMNIQPQSKTDPETQKKVKDYWGPSLKMMQDSGFLQSLVNYDKEGIEQPLIDKIQEYITQEDFQIERLKKVSSVAMNLAKWVFAMDKFYRVNKIVKPKKEQLKVAEEKYESVMKVLKVKQAELKKVVDQVNALQKDLNDTKEAKESLEAKVADCQAKLIRAEQLIKGLGGEKARWKAESERLSIVFYNLTGDILISSGMIAYLGAFTMTFRSDLSDVWVQSCQEKEIPNSGKFSLERVLGNAVHIRNWGLAGLPNDSFSIENAIINDKTKRWPLFIDPQIQANKWLKSMEKERGLKILKFTDGNYLKILEMAIRMGNPVLIENIGEELDPAIEPLLQKQIVVKGNSMTLKIGDAIIDYAKEFKFYLTTKLRNPHYLPEVSTKVTLVNFMITFEGLSDQLLNQVVEKENPELQTKKEALVIEGAKNKNKLQEVEDQILATLQGSDDILGDAAGIEILQNAKVVSEDINKKQAVAEKVEIEIDEARNGYKPVAQRTSGLFFCIADLANVDPMYQYSLDFFKGLFDTAILSSEQSDDLEERLGFLNKEMLESLYRNICRSLFERHKPIFAALLTIKIKEMNNTLNPAHKSFLLTGGVSLGEELPKNPTKWLLEKQWGELNRLDKLEGFEGYIEHFMQNHDGFYKDWYDSSNPQDFPMPPKWEKLDKFGYLCLQRTIRPDLLIPSLSNFVLENIGEYFITPPPFDLGVVFKDSSPTTPLIFVLSPGADPLNSLEKYAETKKKQVGKVSLGQGQGPKAEQMIEEGLKTGTWVVLQNCHLAVSWMGRLEKICEDLPSQKIHRDFRLWLTSYPSNAFPVSILQNGVKMTNEPPLGLKSNLLGTYATDPISNRTWFDSCTLPKLFRKMLFGLCFYHAYIQERVQYGPLGWCIKYQFTESDLRISAMQLQIFIDEYPDKLPLDALRYLTGECNYGGKVTDARDRVLMECVIKQFYCEEICYDDDYKFSPSGLYFAPKHMEYDGYIDFINKLPNFPEPEAFGFHENAAITKNQNATNEALLTILITQQSAGGGGGGQDDDTINKLCDTILNDLPQKYDVKAAEKKYPVLYEQSMNTVLTQELDRFNGLIGTIRGSLQNLKKAIKGEVLLSSQLEAALNSLKVGQVPAMWLARSFPSLKSLGGYTKDLFERLQWFADWERDGLPDILWITRFFFTQGFITGTKQNYARKYNIAIDLLDYDFEVIVDQHPAKPEDGVIVTGMFIEGCQWSDDEYSLVESDLKVLFTKCPLVWFKPCKPEDFNKDQSYNCPIYKTSERKGVLMTTGHSTNHVLDMRLPTKAHPDHWRKRGVAILCGLDD